MRKIFDCFTYSNEAKLLEFRLLYLSEVCDYFVIVEAPITFTGHERECSASDILHRLPGAVSKKCRVINVGDMPRGTAIFQCNWEREYYQRNAILRGLKDLGKDDLALICDVDEIPSQDLLEKIRRNGLPSNTYGLSICMNMLSYRADNQQLLSSEKPVIWNAAKLVAGSAMARPETIRRSGNILPDTKIAGWHFSYMGGLSTIRQKINDFAHQEFNSDSYSRELESRISQNVDLFGRDLLYRHFAHDKLPSLLLEKQGFRDYFLPERPVVGF
jgi:hypothetical protein